ncbi:uncharacterized protein [Rutidosis leptorrhynchoides]|uniref:uncharacterized protein n=1 Tax=Rutidosis leptorrhynchoides TaxID=125765 RepID=UPI003A99F46D
MNYAEQLFVYHSSVSNIGPTKAYEVYSNMKGSEKNVHGTVTDFRNWRRDLNVFIYVSDSQMLVNKMEERKKYVPGFSFEYKLEKSQLHSIFWADEVAKCNYKEFSDIISFDATYRTNRYNMKFVPFTGIDNRHRCVTVAAGLIRDETVESYTWLLTCFMKTFGKEPNMIVIDQDKSMAIAIKAVFKTANHRICMWHIMQKVPSKIPEAIPTIEDEVEKDLKNRLNKLVWNMYIEPNRSKQESLDAQIIKKNPKLLTQLKIEKHALKVYTHAIFAIVQKEIYEALYSCLLVKWTRRKKQKSMLLKRKKRRQKRVLHNSKDGSMNKNIEEIPEKYIMRRWRRDIIPPELRSRRNRYGNENIVVHDSVNEITSVVYDCVELVGSDEKMLKVVLEKLKLLKKEVEAQVPKPSKKKDDIIGNMIGVSKPSTIEIQNPPVRIYKGCANDKRLMSGKEKAKRESLLVVNVDVTITIRGLVTKKRKQKNKQKLQKYEVTTELFNDFFYFFILFHTIVNF